MSRLKEIVSYKNTVIQQLVGNQDVIKAVYYRDQNFLDKPDVSPESVIYSNIYPYNFIPDESENISEAKTYITVYTTGFRKAGGVHFNASKLVIDVFCNRDLFRTDYGFLRTDYIASEIHELLEGKRGIGIGQLEFMSMDHLFVNTMYTGYQMIYRPVELG